MPDYSLLAHFHYVGLIRVAGFLGAMECALQEGPSKDWFGSEPVTIAIVISAVSGVAFFRAWRPRVSRSSTSPHSRRQFLDRGDVPLLLGIGLYGLTYIFPVYLAVVRGYSSLMIGKTMFVPACMLLTAPFAGRLINRVDPRIMIAAGFILFAIGTYIRLLLSPSTGTSGSFCGRKSSAALG